MEPKNENTNNPPSNFFSGSVPKNYDAYMGPILFTPYALDLVSRVKMKGEIKILELAAGTGRVTKELVNLLPEANIIATDISEDMMIVGKENIQSPNLLWMNVNMNDIPFANEEFDLIVCQFGLMFVPDKLKALKEIFRVLKKGGQLLFNTWGKMEANPMWFISIEFLTQTFGAFPMPPQMGPFGLPDMEVVKNLLYVSGFSEIAAFEVHKSSTLESATLAAKSFLMTSPAVAAKPEIFPELQTALEKRLGEKLGYHPLSAPLLALVFDIIK